MRALIPLLLLCATLPAASIWIEGEDASERDLRPHGWYDDVNAEALSGGTWLGHFSHEQEGRAGFRFAIEAAGDYVLWLRANTHSARLSYRLDGGEWQQVDFDGQVLRGKTLITADRQLDIRTLAWARAGTFPLATGEHLLEVRFHSDNQNHGAIDCLVLTTADWKPFGTDRPPE